LQTLLLLDVDGTLIHDRGYRHAMVAAAQHICRQHGLPDWAPTDHEINMLHACGYSNEWDSVPFIVGINLLDAAHGGGARPDFGAWAVRTNAFSGLPNERARDALMAEAPPQIHTELHGLLDDVRDPRTSPTTRLLYTLVLGSALFEQHYGLPAEIDSPSMLETMDVPLIDDRSRDIIMSNPASVYTARPSLPPAGTPGLYQTPEAEIAVRQLKLDGIPLMGLGPMQWLVDRFGGGLWDYAKPAPVQPVAAMLAATGVPAGEAALAAYATLRVFRDDHGGAPSEIASAIESLGGATVIVLEDNAGGVRAAREAAAALAERSAVVEVIGYGVAKDDAKRSALAEICDRVFDDVNQALAAVV
jgi:hypothetical protein